MSKSRHILPPRRYWRDWEREFLQQCYADHTTEALAAVLGRSVTQVLAKANSMGLHKSLELVAEIARRRIAEDPQHGGRATQFRPGLVPANKGLRRPGWSAGRMRESQFRKGNRPHTWVPVGSLRVTPEGVLERKVNDLPGPSAVRWKPVHLLVWEEANGPVPAGMVLAFRPGRKTTDPALITLDALELLTRAQLMARNTIHNLPGPLKEVVRLRASLARAINRKAEEAQEP